MTVLRTKREQAGMTGRPRGLLTAGEALKSGYAFGGREGWRTRDGRHLSAKLVLSC